MKKIIFLFALTIGISGIVRAQNESDEFTKIRQSIRENVSKEMIGWTSHAVEPIEGSRDVLIEQWELGDIIVKIAVVTLPQIRTIEK